MYQEGAFNKRADAIATAASASVVDGMAAMMDENWDPRAQAVIMGY